MCFRFIFAQYDNDEACSKAHKKLQNAKLGDVVIKVEFAKRNLTAKEKEEKENKKKREKNAKKRESKARKRAAQKAAKAAAGDDDDGKICV